ncbi:hypothetical protein FE393_05800 [Xenorhabdus sp. psl]|nr:hypothetical protein [Xenorhabdus sp. psl]
MITFHLLSYFFEIEVIWGYHKPKFQAGFISNKANFTKGENKIVSDFVYLPEAPLKIFFILSVMHPLHNTLKALLHLI